MKKFIFAILLSALIFIPFAIGQVIQPQLPIILNNAKIVVLDYGIVSIIPATQTATIGQQVSFEIKATKIVDAVSWDFQINYDPTILNPDPATITITHGTFLKDRNNIGSNNMPVSNKATAGQIQIGDVAFPLPAKGQGANTNPDEWITLCTITMQTLKAGTTDLTFSRGAVYIGE